MYVSTGVSSLCAGTTELGYAANDRKFKTNLQFITANVRDG